MDRPQTSAELLTAFQRAVKRLDAGLAQMDEGNPLGVDQVAGVLRLLTVPDKGNRLLERARDAFALGPAPPITSITGPAPKSETGLTFPLGSIPYDHEPPADSSPVSTPELLDSRCLLVSDTASQVSYRWVSLIAVIANKLRSVHTDAELPKAVDELSAYIIGGVPVLRYGLRIVAATVAADAHGVLRGIDPAHRPVDHEPVPEGHWVGAVRIHGSLDSKLSIQVETRVQRGVDLVGWVSPGRIDWLFDPPGIAGVPPPDRSHTGPRRVRAQPTLPLPERAQVRALLRQIAEVLCRHQRGCGVELQRIVLELPVPQVGERRVPLHDLGHRRLPHHRQVPALAPPHLQTYVRVMPGNWRAGFRYAHELPDPAPDEGPGLTWRQLDANSWSGTWASKIHGTVTRNADGWLAYVRLADPPGLSPITTVGRYPSADEAMVAADQVWRGRPGLTGS